MVDDDYIRAQIDMMEVKGRTPPNLVGSFIISDNTKADFAAVDFGWGRAEYGGVAVAGAPGTSVPIRVRSTRSGIEKIMVQIWLPTTAIQTFQQELSYATG